jgi:hypothetical protein
MSEPHEPPRPRDEAIEHELESLRRQEREGHATPKEQRRAEELEHRLRADELGAERRERGAEDRAEDRENAEERRRHRHS